MHRKLNRNLYRALASLICAALLFFLICQTVSLTFAQDKCTNELKKAQENYSHGEFDTAIGLIAKCLRKKGLTKTEIIRAYELLALSYLGKQNPQQAKVIIKKIFSVNKKYEPDSVQLKPDYVQLVEEVRKQLKPVSSKKWLWLGAGGGAVIVAALLLSGGGGNGPKPPPDGGFPNPPGRPK